MSLAIGDRTVHLPLELTSFVGRRTELADAKRLLGTHRLVTVTGIGGVGKTRLALRVAPPIHSNPLVVGNSSPSTVSAARIALASAFMPPSMT